MHTYTTLVMIDMCELLEAHKKPKVMFSWNFQAKKRINDVVCIPELRFEKRETFQTILEINTDGSLFKIFLARTQNNINFHI